MNASPPRLNPRRRLTALDILIYSAAGIACLVFFIAPAITDARKDAAEKRRQEEARLLEASLPKHQQEPTKRSGMVRAKGHLKAGLMVFSESSTGYDHWFTVVNPHSRTGKDGSTYMLVRYSPGSSIPGRDNTAEFPVDLLNRSDLVTPIYSEN